jgi:hypothetical protein
MYSTLSYDTVRRTSSRSIIVISYRTAGARV